jgi:putative membrane protein
MIANSLMAFLHHIFAFTLTACLVYEFIAFRRGMTINVGLLRVFLFEKGVNFYINSPFFWVKMAAFLIVGLVSIDPTIRYIRWNKSLNENKMPVIDDKEFNRTRLILWLEVIGIGIILLAASLMARGVGMN